ncbi:comm domain-containing protein 5-like [Plakobranchus ocellatus]|uniref:COMM domain-containing protein 5 n=1 Tax=Plakobranchus ocellatus TaxID=259542 RepID=A0AAV3YI63_9GAST|nr:comm domain-containing protein 5-like [Plakobranchus ocellatus]
MSIIQVKGGGGTVGLERTSFVGARVPNEIRAIIKPLSKIDKATFKKILKVIVSEIQGVELTFEDLRPLLNETLTEEVLAVLYCGLDELVRRALKLPHSSLKKENFIQDLQDLQIPESFHEDLVAVVAGAKRSQIDSHLEDNRPRLPSLENLAWRTDVAISTGVLNRVLVRGVTMEMTLSDGSIKDFEMTVSKFQELRFHVASVLSEMEKLEKHSILKIKD